MKNSNDTIRNWTFRLVAQCLNQLRPPLPPYCEVRPEILNIDQLPLMPQVGKKLSFRPRLLLCSNFAVISASWQYCLHLRNSGLIVMSDRTRFNPLRTKCISPYRAVNTIHFGYKQLSVNTLRTGDADLRFYITTVQDGWRKSAFLTRACFPAQYT